MDYHKAKTDLKYLLCIPNLAGRWPRPSWSMLILGAMVTLDSPEQIVNITWFAT